MKTTGDSGSVPRDTNLFKWFSLLTTRALKPEQRAKLNKSTTIRRRLNVPMPDGSISQIGTLQLSRECDFQIAVINSQPEMFFEIPREVSDTLPPTVPRVLLDDALMSTYLCQAWNVNKRNFLSFVEILQFVMLNSSDEHGRRIRPGEKFQNKGDENLFRSDLERSLRNRVQAVQALRHHSTQPQDT